MSNTSNQATMVGICEGSGNGTSLGVAVATSSRTTTHPLVPVLVPSRSQIVNLLKGTKIAKKREKYSAFKAIFQLKAEIADYLNSLNAGSSANFDAVKWETALKTVNNYNAGQLGELIGNIRNATMLIAPSSSNHAGLGFLQEKAINTIHIYYDQAKHDASYEIQSKSTSQCLTVKEPERDRKFLEDGYLPTDPAMRDCLFCGCQGTVDEPNTNLQAVQNNILIHRRHQGQLAQYTRPVLGENRFSQTLEL